MTLPLQIALLCAVFWRCLLGGLTGSLWGGL